MGVRVELQETMGSDRSIAEAAWTSSYDLQKKTQRSDEDVKRIINMLADLKHSVPFESVILRFWIKLPIAADRQHMTHRIASHSGMSGRYRTMPNEWLKPTDDIKEITQKLGVAWSMVSLDQYNQLAKKTNDWYRDMLEDLKEAEKRKEITNQEYKRCREFFRGILPQNNMTERVTIMNLRSFANYQKLRNSKHAQVEIRQIAEQMLEQVKNKNICPIALAALERNGWSI